MDERIYTINIRKAIAKAPRWEKSKRSVAVVKNFLKRHMKGDDVKIGKSITEEIWVHACDWKHELGKEKVNLQQIYDAVKLALEKAPVPIKTE